MLGLLPQRRLWLIELYIPDNVIGTKTEPCPKIPQGRQGLNRLMIVTQVYNPFACYQMSRPQSILMRFNLDIFKCTHYLLHMYFRQFFLKSMYFSSCKIPENQESASLTILNKVLAYTGYTMTRCMQKVFIAAYIRLCDNSHICCLWPEKDPIWFVGGDIKLAAWTLQCFSAMILNHSLLYDDAVNDMKRTFLIVWSKILDGRSWSNFNIHLCTLHTQTIQSSQLDRWYFLQCGNDFWRIYTYFGVKLWPLKVKLRVLNSCNWWFCLHLQRIHIWVRVTHTTD